jgi:transcription elongation factor GreA
VVVYKIVGEDEANIENNRISVASPLARALIGKELDEQVQVKTPGGIKEYIILDILFE